MSRHPSLLRVVAAFVLALASARGALPPPPDLKDWLQLLTPTSVFSDPDYNIWCGSVVAGDDGRYHLFYSRWPRSTGHLAWVSHSEVARAVSDSPLGPFRHVDVVLPARGAAFWDGSCTHNPTVIRLGSRYYLYYMGNQGDGKLLPGELNFTHRNRQRIGVAVADRPEGPWTRFDRPVLDVSPDATAADALMVSNPSVVARPEGGVLMVYKAVGRERPLPFGGPVVHLTATAADPLGPFTKHPQPLFTRPGTTFAAEDPFVWHDGQRYLALVKDMGGYFTGVSPSLALFHSTDGQTDWAPAPQPLVSGTELRRPDGTRWQLVKLERPQLLMRNGQPWVLYCAAADQPDLNGSVNVAIPLRSPVP